MRQWMCVVVLAGLLVACAPAAVITESTATPVGSGVEAAIVFEKGGGITGSQEKWTIFADGSITREDAPDAAPVIMGSVTAEQVSGLLAGLDGLGFFQLQERYGADDNCADCFQYTVTVTKGGVTKSVSTHDAASDAPPEVEQALALIQTLLATTN
jgi:hypothetical protein